MFSKSDQPDALQESHPITETHSGKCIPDQLQDTLLVGNIAIARPSSFRNLLTAPSSPIRFR
jgi:hypothetical protein